MPEDEFRHAALFFQLCKFFFGHDDDGVDVRIGAGGAFDDGSVEHGGDDALLPFVISFQILYGSLVMSVHGQTPILCFYDSITARAFFCKRRKQKNEMPQVLFRKEKRLIFS